MCVSRLGLTSISCSSSIQNLRWECYRIVKTCGEGWCRFSKPVSFFIFKDGYLSNILPLPLLMYPSRPITRQNFSRLSPNTLMVFLSSYRNNWNLICYLWINRYSCNARIIFAVQVRQDHFAAKRKREERRYILDILRSDRRIFADWW